MGDESIREDDLYSVEDEWNDRDRNEEAAFWDAEEVGLLEPPDDSDGDVEWIDEPSPQERWERYRDDESEPDRLQELVDALTALGCKNAELLPALLRLKHAYWLPSARRSDLLEHADRIARAKEYLAVSIGDMFSNEDWDRLQDLLDRYEQHLRLHAERLKRNPHLARRESLIALLEHVQKATREPRYQILSELLVGFVDESLTEVNLRQYASRAGLPKERASKPRVPTRRPSKRGRKVDLSGHVKGKRVRQAKANAGLDRWNDDEGEWN